VFGSAADDDISGHSDDGDALLEQLHCHLDQIEGALILGVRARSGEFFAAVDELQLLSLDVASALKETSIARAALATVDREIVGSALQVCLCIFQRTCSLFINVQVARLARRRERLGQLLEIALNVARIRQAPALVQQKLAGGNFLGALQLLRHTHAQLQSKQVEGISCLSSMAGELEGVRDAVHKMMGQEVLEVACGLFDGCMQRADARPFSASPAPASSETTATTGVAEYVPSADDRRLLLVIAGLLHRCVFALCRAIDDCNVCSQHASCQW
jgi:hypothetical protein